MSNIAISDSHNYTIQQGQINNFGKIAEDNNIYPLVPDNLQAFVTLATKPGMMMSILQGQSVMANLDMRPTLSSPPVGQAKINSEHTDELMKLMVTVTGSDINKLERAAASASTIFNTQPNLLQTTASAATANKALPVSSPSTASVAHPVHSQIPVESGTDITAADAPGRKFINMMGDMKMLALNNQLTVTLLKQEAEFASSCALSSLRAVDGAERSGNKGINAEKQRMTGAITSGTIGLVGQAVTTTRTVNALKNESKSIGDSLASATTVEKMQGTHQSAMSSSIDSMLHQGKPLNETISGTMGTGISPATSFSGTKRSDHTQIQLKTSQTRTISDYSNTAIASSQKVIDGAFNVEAANETKQAELARADQTVNNEIANTHQQAARKSAEAKAALNQVLESTLNSKNSALSSIADRIR